MAGWRGGGMYMAMVKTAMLTISSPACSEEDSKSGSFECVIGSRHSL